MVELSIHERVCEVRNLFLVLAFLALAPAARADDPPAYDALWEVNNARAARGLPPFAWDDGLTRAAAQCAAFRAVRRIEGHTGNDFAALPPGSWASAAGCAAWHPSWGWGSCCCYDNYRVAGAAWAMGADGRRYMHLFVR